MRVIAVDAMGGDHAPSVVVQGAIDYIREHNDESVIVLIGKEDVIDEQLTGKDYSASRLQIVHASEVIEMHEHPAKAVQAKQNSSINIGFGMLAKGKAHAFCSAGNTGAMMVGSLFGIKAIDGILRPAIAGFAPQLDGSFSIILDIGANAECKPEFLEQFGEIGSLYAQHVMGINMPRVGLMNIGEEEQKGTTVLQNAYQLLKNNSRINFIGNIEGRDLFINKCDVVVCDGFTGNVILKLAESIYPLIKQKGTINEFFNHFNYEFTGGSPILGVNGNVIIGHGSSSAMAIKNMIRISHEMAKANINDILKKAYTSLNT